MIEQQRRRYSEGDRFESVIERLVAGGAGLARGPYGAVLVEGAAPGDRAEIEIESFRGGAPRGRFVALLHHGPGRAEAPCPYYGRCGGCDLQHMTYDSQLEAKVQIAADAFERIGGLTLPGHVGLHPAPQPFGSRARVELHADQATGAVGFFERRSHTVVDIERCLVSRDEIDGALRDIRQLRRPLPPSIHLLGGNRTVRSDPALPPIEGGSFWLEIGELDYLVDPRTFFQSSLDLLPELIGTVIEAAGDKSELAWDLFAGAGLFSLPLAQHVERVEGVDSDARAICNAVRSAEKNRIGNVRFGTDDVRHWVSERIRNRMCPDLIVVDPPRSGLGPELSAALAAHNPNRFVYVSCDPTTLARDLRTIVSGSLRIASVDIFDLFPQTHHLETVVRLEAD